MILTNSELPLCMLEDNVKLNDFDLVLYHLFESNERYKQYYLNIRKQYPERLMILDNSAYEFYIQGKVCDFDKLVECIILLKPNYYILPDTLMNYSETISKSSNFLNKYNEVIDHKTNGKSRPMAVLQGNCIEEFEQCIDKYIDLGIKAIAIPFHNSFYCDLWNGYDMHPFLKVYKQVNKDIEYAAGRVHLIKKINAHIGSHFEWIHMLGSHCPYEKYVVNESVVNSMDTGYPVKCGYEGYLLGQEPQKPNIIIDDFFEEDLSEQQKTIIAQNVKIFHQL